MELTKPQDILSLCSGDTVSKRNLFALIQYSKVEGSDQWSGAEWVIGNTPQQGINWIGNFPHVEAVIIKTRPGSYSDDGWSDDRKRTYQYSFKARKGAISFAEKANQVLVQQPEYQYPVLLFTENGNEWYFEGSFAVSDILERFVVLRRGSMPAAAQTSLPSNGKTFHEGGRRYVSHLLVERNRSVVKTLKNTSDWICDVCQLDFFERYGVRYIEAHHKIPISTYTSAQAVDESDFVLLCPNCHKAVHAYMKQDELEYDGIKILLVDQLELGLAD